MHGMHCLNPWQISIEDSFHLRLSLGGAPQNRCLARKISVDFNMASFESIGQKAAC